MNDTIYSVDESFLHENHDLFILVVLEVIICITFIVGTILNTVLVILFFRRRGFRTLSNRFVLNLAIANLFSLLLLTPLSLLDQIASSIMEKASFCFVLTLVATMVSVVILLSTLLIGIDQYMAIVNPLDYHNRVNTGRVVSLCCLVWLLSFITSLVVVMDPTTDATITYFTWSRTCQPLHPYSNYKLWVCVVVVVIVYFIPFTVITVTYVRIFTAARGNSIRTRRNSVSSLRRTSVSSMHRQAILSPNLRTPHSTSQQILANFSNLTSSMKSKLSHASTLLLYKEETRAARVTILIVLVVALCWGPYLTCLILHTGHTPVPPPPWLHPLSLALINCYTVISPLIYAYRSRKVQRDVKEVLGIKTHMTKQEKMFKKLKSFSCPHLALTSCNTLPGPVVSLPTMKACRSFTDMKARQFHLTMPAGGNGDHCSETTPCIEITPPTWPHKTSFDYTTAALTSAPSSWISGQRPADKHGRLSPASDKIR